MPNVLYKEIFQQHGFLVNAETKKEPCVNHGLSRNCKFYGKWVKPIAAVKHNATVGLHLWEGV